MQNVKWCKTEGGKVLVQLGGIFPHSQNCQQRSISPRDIGWPTHTKDLECHTFKVLFQLNCISRTCNFEIPLMQKLPFVIKCY